MGRDRPTPTPDGPTVDPARIDNANRRRLFEAVVANPGAGLADRAAASDLGYSTARHHLTALSRTGRVSTAKIPGKRRAFPPSVDAPRTGRRARRRRDGRRPRRGRRLRPIARHHPR